jgi:hypothetical protein
MNSLKCASCRLVYIDRGHRCPRCGEFNQHEAARPEEARGARSAVAAPVGEAEFVKVNQVLDGPGAGKVRKMTVEVFWRWRPNAFGQTFDKSGMTFGLLPEGRATRRPASGSTAAPS